VLRLLHTSDWHLGHTLHDLSRKREHAAFLAWLLDRLEEHEVDALLIAGDVFETANPPSHAMTAWYAFLAAAHRRRPGLDVVVIAGNHDSAARLDAAHPLLEGLGIQVVGAVPRTEAGALASGELLVPLHDAAGEVAAWCVAVPFLRPTDLPSRMQPGLLDAGDPLVAGVRAVYDDAFEAARTQRQPGQALVGMGHCYMVGGTLSELSERRILGGNQHALPASIFPTDCAYAALGHLHRAQKVGGREEIRYSGSPLPLAIDEDRYRHQVVLAELEGETMARWEAIAVPRSIEVLRIPGPAGAPWETVAAQLAELPSADQAGPPEDWPYLEVRVCLDGPHPSLRRDVEEALEGKAVRLVKLAALRAGAGGTLADDAPDQALTDLQPVDVLERLWARTHGGEPSDEVRSCFDQLLDELGQQGA